MLSRLKKSDKDEHTAHDSTQKININNNNAALKMKSDVCLFYLEKIQQQKKKKKKNEIKESNHNLQFTWPNGTGTKK